MAYRLRLVEPSLQTELHRIATEQLADTPAALSADGEALHLAVHDVRKRLKKVRGLLRLFRGALPDYGELNHGLRDAGRLISDLRDRTALVETLDTLATRGGRPGQVATAPLRAAFVEARQDALGSDDLAQRIDEARRRLTDIVEGITDWKLEDGGWAAIAPGLARSYRSARKAAEAVKADPPPEREHEWRKRMKDHWYQTRLLRELWPKPLKVRAAALDRVTDLLGENHDLVVLGPHLQSDELDAEGRRDAAAPLRPSVWREPAPRPTCSRPGSSRTSRRSLVRRWKTYWKLQTDR